MSDQKLVIRLEPRAEALPAMLDRLEAYAEATGLAARVAYRLAVICEELAANVAMHGAAGEGGATYFEVAVERLDDRLRITFEDDGRPFDPLARVRPDTALTLEKREIGGLGIHFVRSLARDVSYARLGSINRLTVILDTVE